MKIVTPKQMNEIDHLTIMQIGIPGIVLMENAALKVVEEILNVQSNLNDKSIFLFAGKGNNGGDAFAVARHLYNKGAKVFVYAAAQKKDISGDAKTNLDIIENMGITVTELLDTTQLEDLQRKLPVADIIVDGIFGTGLKGEIKGVIKELITIINSSGKYVISIDIPSGISGETGRIMGTCIRACKTVTFALPKIGNIFHPGCEFVRELKIVDISIPDKIIEGMGITLNTIDTSYVSKLLPLRNSNSNKGSFGKAFVLTGSLGMTGAGCLTGGAALRTGAGLVYLGVPSSLSQIYDTLLLESVTISLEDNKTGFLVKPCLSAIYTQLERMTVAALGPGLSVNNDIVDIVEGIIENANIPLILDADALNAVSTHTDMLRKLKLPAVVTPHPGEMARLLGITSEEVQNNRITAAREFASRWKVTTVLKGSRTIIAMPDGTIYINTTGNSGMATGGTGDVLTGIIAGLIAQGVQPGDAAVAGVYIHGAAGDSIAKVKGEHGLIAGDIVGEIPAVIKGLMAK